MKYLFIEQLNKAQQNKYDLHNFILRMSRYLAKRPAMSKMLNEPVDELETEYTMCPCGRGLLVVTIKKSPACYGHKIITPHLVCSDCSSTFEMHAIKLYPESAMDADLKVRLIDRNNHYQYELNPYPRAIWKMLSWK